MNEHVQNKEVIKTTRRLFLNATCFVLLFIFYASLLPYNVTSSAIDMSLSSFLTTLQYSDLDAEQGQWIGHVIFNALVTFLASVYCGFFREKKRWYVMFGLIFLIGFLVEYFQMFIGNRGTSISDVYANFAGMIFGFLAWVFFGKFTVSATLFVMENKTLPVRMVRKIYLMFVIAVILFPFDFFINSLQFEIAFATKGYPLFERDMDQGIGSISLLAAMVLTFPLGVLYELSGRKRRRKTKVLFAQFFFLFLLLEILQFFEVSGQSSLLSFGFKFVGFFAGYHLGRYINLETFFDFIVSLRKVFYFLLIPFLWVVLKLKGLSFEISASVENIMSVIAETSFLPFNYYITVGSGEALLSFLLNFVIFVPIGGLLAIYHIASESVHTISSARLMRMGFIGALILELLVLFWGLKRPDVTNILVSGFALPMGYYFVLMIKNGLYTSDAEERASQA